MSDKTIVDKMFLKNAKSMLVINGKAHPSMVAQFPPELIKDDATIVDVVVLLALNQAELTQYLPQALARLGDKGSLWIAYLKQSASKATDIHRDIIDTFAQQHGATAVAMISVDLDWSALRLKRMTV
ncbi:MAG: DUF3052 family protein [Pseudomonadota bacterium]|nr:DUF3052 family protein [Pseudomonadota bacterium]